MVSVEHKLPKTLTNHKEFSYEVHQKGSGESTKGIILNKYFQTPFFQPFYPLFSSISSYTLKRYGHITKLTKGGYSYPDFQRGATPTQPYTLGGST